MTSSVWTPFSQVSLLSFGVESEHTFLDYIKGGWVSCLPAVIVYMSACYINVCGRLLRATTQSLIAFTVISFLKVPIRTVQNDLWAKFWSQLVWKPILVHNQFYTPCVSSWNLQCMYTEKRFEWFTIYNLHKNMTVEDLQSLFSILVFSVYMYV